MELGVISLNGQKNKMTVSDSNFAVDYNEGLIHQVLTAYMAAGRAGTSAQKSRSEVSGGGKKPWRQKGTGRARAGTIRSPIWRSGGVTFAAKTRNYAQKVNRKMYRAAIKSILSELIRHDRLIVINELTLEQPKTKELIKVLQQLGIPSNNALIVTEELNINLELAGRNIHTLGICLASEITPLNLLQYEKVLVTENALKSLEEKFA